MPVKLKHKYRRARPDRIDPTRTVTVRKRYVAEIRRRFARLRGDIVRLLLDDVFGIKRRLVGNVFCATGEGGGVDPSCSPGDSSHVTKTTAFKAWFGDSKVVDEKGEPLRVYHGTKANFDSFGNAGGRATWDAGYSGKGFYFADSGTASVYAGKVAGGNIIPVYLKMDNPLIVKEVKGGDDQIIQVAKSLGIKLPPEVNGINAKRLVPTISDDITTALHKAGYDGVIYHRASGLHQEYMVPLSNQIKSATGNRGTFDPKDNRIANAADDSKRAWQFKLVGNVFCATGEGGGVDPTCSPSGSVGTREEQILAKAEKIPVTTTIATTSVYRDDYDEIKNRMTGDERNEMESELSRIKDTSVDEMMNDYETNVDRSDVARHKDLDHEIMLDKVKELIEEHTDTTEDEERLLEELDNISFRSRHYADDTVDHVIDSITDAPEVLVEKLRELRDNVREELDDAVKEEEEREQNEARSQYEYDYDSSSDEVDYLRNFYSENEDRFTESNCEDDVWCKDDDGDGVYAFKTSTGARYTVAAVKRQDSPYPDMQFQDEGGSYAVTGSGNALEVFSKVVPAMVAYIKKQDLDGATFSAAEPSRQRLYDRLVKTVAKTMPDYFAVSIDKGTTRYYGIGKRAKRDEMLNSVKDRVGVQEFRVIVNVKDDWWAEEAWQTLVTNAADDSKRAWQFKTSSEQVKAFQEWLRERFGHHLSIKQLMKRFAEEGYKRGIGRAFDDVEKPYAQGFAMDYSTGDFYKPSKMQFLKSAFGSSVGKERVDQLASRSFDDLKNVTSDMSTRMSRTLLEGLVDGSHPLKIAKTLSKDLDISLGRAEMIARTEIIRAHAEGQLDAMEKMGVQEVGVQVEWLTAGDDAVCPRCAAMEGAIFDIQKAHNLIPKHPNCRCSFTAAGNVLYPKPVGDAADEGFTENVYCATGEGGGIDPTCSPSKAGTGFEAKIGDALETGLHWSSDKIKAAEHWTLAKLNLLPKEQGVGVKEPTVKTAIKLGISTAFSGWTISQSLAEKISVEKGNTPEQAARLRASLAVADVLAFKPAAIATAPLGGIAAAASWIVPPVTGAYLIHSTVRHPIRTFRAATKLVDEFLNRHTQVLNVTTTPSPAQAIIDAIKAHNYDDWYVAILHASGMDIGVADQVYAANPKDTSDQDDSTDDEQWLRDMTKG